jgi:hypothetical protein
MQRLGCKASEYQRGYELDLEAVTVGRGHGRDNNWFINTIVEL